MRAHYETHRNTFFIPANLPQDKQIKNNEACTGQKAYDILTAYLKLSDKRDLTQQLEKIEADPALADKINKGDWGTLFKECDLELFPLQALRCLKEGFITDMAFSTSQLFFTVWTDEENIQETCAPMRFISVFNNKNERTRNADLMIDATMKLVSSSYEKRLLHKIGLNLETKEFKFNIKYAQKYNKIEGQKDKTTWNLEQKKRFYLKLLKLPHSEHSFLLVHDSLIEDVNDKHVSVIDAINFKYGFNALSRLCVNDKPMRMIPSRGMMQAYLEAMSPDTTPLPMYRLSPSTVLGLHYTLKANGKDLFQSFKYLPQYIPLLVDSYPASSRYVEAELHDLYHHMRISHIPLIERQLFIELTDELLAFACKPVGYLRGIAKDLGDNVENKVKNKFARALAIQLIDMEHGAYDINLKLLLEVYPRGARPTKDPIQRFWHTLDRAAKSAFLLTEINETEFLETLEALMRWMLNCESENYKTIIDSIFDFEEFEYPVEDQFHFSSLLRKKFEIWDEYSMEQAFNSHCVPNFQ
jgi:hypothetical protein